MSALPRSDLPRVLWRPPADVRERTEIGRYVTWLERERGLAFAAYDELWRWSVDDLAGFWGSIWDFFEVKAHAPYDTVLARDDMPGATWFPGARLNFAEHLMGSEADGGPRCRRRALADPRPRRAVFPGRPGAGRAGARGPCAPGRRPGRPRGRLPAEHPRDAGGVRGDGEPRSDLGELRTRARRAQRRRPPRAARSGGPADGRRLRLPRPLDRPPRRGGDDPRRPPGAAPSRTHPLRRPGDSGRAALVRAARRARPARVPARRVRPPTLRAVLVGHDRPAEGHRPRARRHPARAAQGARAELGPEAGRPPALVHDDVVDDVERARRGAARAVVDRHARRRPGLARPGLAVAARRGDAPDLHGRQPGLSDGLPQGGPPAGARARPQLDPGVRHRRLAAPGRGLPLRLRPARPRRAADQRQRRHRRLQRDRGAPPCCRSTRARSRAACSASPPMPSTRRASRSSASSASS